MASKANPYAEYLAGASPEESLARAPKQLAEAAERLGADGLKRSYAPGKWTARQVFCHLADTELAFSFRLRQALADPHHVIQPFDQDAWAKPYTDESLDAATALQVFSIVRDWNLRLLKTVPPENRSKVVIHPERGEMTFQTIVETMAGHDAHHLKQLQSISGTESPKSAAR